VPKLGRRPLTRGRLFVFRARPAQPPVTRAFAIWRALPGADCGRLSETIEIVSTVSAMVNVTDVMALRGLTGTR
jgi:hypothetical protein